MYLLFTSFFNNVEAQVEINAYEPNGIPNFANSNDDFSVSVTPLSEPSSSSIDLFVYSTWVNDEGFYEPGYGNPGFIGYTTDYGESSFVNFDFSGGPIQIKLKCNYCYDENIDIKTVVIRPRNYSITPIIDNVNKTITFKLINPLNLSVEINGNRTRNMHIFSSELNDLEPTTHYTTVTEMTNNLEQRRGQSLDSDEVWYYPNSGDTIYIDGNEVFRGGIYLDGVSDVSIIGRGIIDNQGFQKNYCHPNGNNPNCDSIPLGYDYVMGIRVRKSSNINITGIIINDVQHHAIKITESENVTIKDYKAITRVIWGEGIYLEASKNFTASELFIRSAEDCIAIYAGRNIGNWMTEGGIDNVTVTNSSFYADRAHPIALGWHGPVIDGESLIPDENVAHLQNITFENIDILQHDEYLNDYHGAIAINCGDNNYCQNMLFKDIRVEDFNYGALLRLKVEPEGAANIVRSDGYRINNIVFDGLTYNYSNSNDSNSIITGLSQARYVNGVHFNNLVINYNSIQNASQYPKFVLGNDIYDITFNDLPKNTLPFDINSNPNGIKNGKYRIQNVETIGTMPRYLNIENTFDSIITAPWITDWFISYTGNNSYTIKSKGSNKYIGGTNDTGITDPINIYNEEELLDQDNLKNIEWELIYIETDSDGDDLYRIRNKWWDHNSLQKSAVIENNSKTPVNIAPWENLDRQKWKLNLIEERQVSLPNNGKIIFYPNPTKDLLNMQNNSSYDTKILIYNKFGKLLLKSKLKANQLEVLNLSGFRRGFYIIHAVNKEGVTIKKIFKE